VDIVKDGQTILTRDLDIENGQAELSLTATPDLRGPSTSMLISSAATRGPSATIARLRAAAR